MIPNPPTTPDGATRTWRKVSWKTPSRSGTVWRRFLDTDKSLDPYLVWADLTNFEGFGGWPPTDAEHDGLLPVLLEASKAGLPVPASNQVPKCEHVENGPVYSELFSLLRLPGAYQTSRSGELFTKSRFLTARVPPCNLGEVLLCGDVQRLQLGLPRLPSTSTAASTAAPSSADFKRERVIVGIIDDGFAFANERFCNARGETRVHFLWDQEGGRADGDASQTGWHRPDFFGYGSELGHVRLTREAMRGDEQLQAYGAVDYVPVRPEPDVQSSRLAQRGADDVPIRLPLQTMVSSTHGTGALDLLAGRTPTSTTASLPETPQDAQAGWRPANEELPGAPRPCRGPDFADKWPLILVQLPTRTSLDTSGGSLGVHVLDGLRYIVSRSEQLPYVTEQVDGASESSPDNEIHDRHSVIINVSYGAIGGPHDGTSILERAMADLVRERRSQKTTVKTWIVVSAGNAQGSRTHARLVLRPSQDKDLLWQVGPDNPHESFLEIWLPAVDVSGCPVTAQTRQRLVVSVQPPGDQPAPPAQLGQAWLWGDDGSIPVAGVVAAHRVSQGEAGTMILVAVAPTRSPLAGEPRRREVAPHGLWTINVAYIASTGDASAAGEMDRAGEVHVHAWSERGDLVYGLPRRQQSTLYHGERVPHTTEYMPESRRRLASTAAPWLAPDAPDELQPEYSFGTLASPPPRDAASVPSPPGNVFKAGGVVTVGSYRLSDGEMAAYSSGGPARSARLDASTAAACTASADASGHRYGPAADAPGDFGTALHGLRVTGTRSASTARLSGTSAAAPTTARFLANQAYAHIWKLEGPQPLASIPNGDAERATPTPAKDDLFRKGDMRIR